jgi:hypothetical protein
MAGTLTRVVSGDRPLEIETYPALFLLIEDQVWAVFQRLSKVTPKRLRDFHLVRQLPTRADGNQDHRLFPVVPGRGAVQTVDAIQRADLDRDEVDGQLTPLP